jgi:hypothetical protein
MEGMNADVFEPGRPRGDLHDAVEVAGVDGLVGRGGEDEVGVRPDVRGLESVELLGGALGAQCVDRVGGQGNGPDRLCGLRGRDGEASAGSGERASDSDRGVLGVEVDVIPPQGERFAAAEPGVGDEDDGAVVAGGFGFDLYRPAGFCAVPLTDDGG